MKVSQKVQRKLEARLKSHTELMRRQADSKVMQRKQSGGYRAPGSRNPRK